MALFLSITMTALNAQTNKSIDINKGVEIEAENSLSGIWHSTQTDVEKIVVTELGNGLYVKWYFKSGNVNQYVLKRISIPGGEKAKVIAKSVDFQHQSGTTIDIYEYRYGKNNRHIGTLIVGNSKIIEIDEDTQDEDYYAKYEWNRK